MRRYANEFGIKPCGKKNMDQNDKEFFQGLFFTIGILLFCAILLGCVLCVQYCTKPVQVIPVHECYINDYPPQNVWNDDSEYGEDTICNTIP